MEVDESKDQQEFNSKLTMTLYRARVIMGAMLMGVVIFLAIAIFIPPFKPPMPGIPIVTLVGIGMTVSELIARKFVLSFMMKKKLSDIAPLSKAIQFGELFDLFIKRIVIGTAMIEGPAFFMVIAYMIERHPASIATALLLIIGIAMQIPTEDKLKAWLSAQLSCLDN